ncbi:MAG: hypothetical protein HKN79_03010 [Flavobacteriales bacterium]|nr:hypothetical protein [Flavobacteriales bacterium]
MNFRQRLLRYLIGVGIGVILSAYFFSDKKHLWTSWLPGNRVKERIVQSYWDVSPEADCHLQCLPNGMEDLRKAISEADVDFKQSDTQGESKTYRLFFTEDASLHYGLFSLRDSVATVVEIETSIPCDCP